jgi:hypothetical protein
VGERRSVKRGRHQKEESRNGNKEEKGIRRKLMFRSEIIRISF